MAHHSSASVPSVCERASGACDIVANLSVAQHRACAANAALQLVQWECGERRGQSMLCARQLHVHVLWPTPLANF